MAIPLMIAFCAVMLFQGKASELQEEKKFLKAKNSELHYQLEQCEKSHVQEQS